jgi:hypothetical protein
MPHALLVLLPVLAILVARPAATQEPTLATVLEKAGAYVLEAQDRLAGIVAEERYVQNAGIAEGTVRRGELSAPRHRELVSDLLFVRPLGADRWVQFRDVFEVDGKRVRDRSERLERLFLAPSASTRDQVRQIVAESTRYNIGTVERTVNVPLLALLFLDPSKQPRFRFARAANASPSMGFPRLPATVWAIDYHESERQTLIRGTNQNDLPSRGRFWIEPATGRVLMTELIAEDVVLRAMIGVRYTEAGSIGPLVPAEMRERYDVRGNAIRGQGSHLEGTATYANFRRFTVIVDETLGPVKK